MVQANLKVQKAGVWLYVKYITIKKIWGTSSGRGGPLEKGKGVRELGFKMYLPVLIC